MRCLRLPLEENVKWGKVVSLLEVERLTGVIPATNYPHQWCMLGASTLFLALCLLPLINSWGAGCMGWKIIKVTQTLNESPPTK